MDVDGDGVPAGIDCNDDDATVGAASAEVCDGVDNDCDGLVDEDVCGDPCQSDDDCDDDDACTVDTCSSGECSYTGLTRVDMDGDGLIDDCDDDTDGDGVPDADDCDPNDASIGAGTPEACDGLDNDCDGQVDEGVCGDPCTSDADCGDADACTDDSCVDGECMYDPIIGVDLDGDGLPDACEPDGDEDGVIDDDDNCPEDFNEAQLDADGDGIGNVCDQDADGDGSPKDEDCNDLDPSVSPDTIETCDGLDNDCDGQIDEDACDVNACGGAGLGCDDDNACTVNDTCWDGLCLGEPLDCDDGNPCSADMCDPTAGCANVTPSETCNDGVDNDCDGAVDEGCAVAPAAIAIELLWDTPGDPDQSDQGPEAGADLDLHYAHPNAASETDNDGDGIPDPWFDGLWDTFWFNPAPEWEGFGAAASGPTVDIDDTDGAGPEFINHMSPDPNLTYRIGVHYWNDHEYGDSEATVRIYVDGLIAMEVTLEGLQHRDLWEVATITGAGEIELIEAADGGMKIIADYDNPAFVGAP